MSCSGVDKTSLKLRNEIGIDIIACECDYPHSDCFWPDAPPDDRGGGDGRAGLLDERAD